MGTMDTICKRKFCSLSLTTTHRTATPFQRWFESKSEKEKEREIAVSFLLLQQQKRQQQKTSSLVVLIHGHGNCHQLLSTYFTKKQNKKDQKPAIEQLRCFCEVRCARLDACKTAQKRKRSMSPVVMHSGCGSSADCGGRVLPKLKKVFSRGHHHNHRHHHHHHLQGALSTCAQHSCCCWCSSSGDRSPAVRRIFKLSPPHCFIDHTHIRICCSPLHFTSLLSLLTY